MTRPLKMPGARASKAVLRERLARALERIVELEERLLEISNTVYTTDVNRHAPCVIALARVRDIAIDRTKPEQLKLSKEPKNAST